MTVIDTVLEAAEVNDIAGTMIGESGIIPPSAVSRPAQGELFRSRYASGRSIAESRLEIKPVYSVKAYEDPIIGELVYIR